MVLATLSEGWFPEAGASRKRHQHGQRCSAAAERRRRRVDMHRWPGPDTASPPPPPAPASSRSRQHTRGGDADGQEAGASAEPRWQSPGAGDLGGEMQLVRPAAARFSRSSSSLEQVPEDVAVVVCHDTAVNPPATCIVRRARYARLAS